MIDTGWQDAGLPREMLVVQGLFSLMNSEMSSAASRYIEGEFTKIWPSFERYGDNLRGGDGGDYVTHHLYLKESANDDNYNYLKDMAKDFGTDDDYDKEGQAIDGYPPVRDAYARLIERLPPHRGQPRARRETKAEALRVAPAPPPEAGSAPLLEAIRTLNPWAVRKALRDFPTLSPPGVGGSPLEAALDHAAFAQKDGRELHLREVVEALLEAMVLWTPTNRVALQKAFQKSKALESPYFSDRIGKHMIDHGFGGPEA